MIYYENCLPADNSHEISYLIFLENWERCRKMCCLLQYDWRFKVNAITPMFDFQVIYYTL